MLLLRYNNSPVETLGSCIVFLYHGNEKYRVLCEVADRKCHKILCRQWSLTIKYVDFPKICEATIDAKPEKMTKTVQKEPATAALRPLTSAIQSSTNEIITIKEYLLIEHADVFQGIGTLIDEDCYIQLKKHYKPIQHPLQQVVFSLRPTYRAVLDRIQNLGIIAEVKQYNEWINSIVPIKKPNGSLKLCLDPKDLNKPIQ